MDTIINEMRSLIEKLNAASDAYYNGRQEILTDYEWDSMFDRLKKLEEEDVDVYRTSEDGTITVTGNGKKDYEVSVTLR